MENEQASLKKVRLGDAAEVAIITYRDYLLTSTNPNPPPDAQQATRAQAHDELPFPHPCSTYLKANEGYKIGGENPEEVYASLVKFCQRHRHNARYCMKNGKCR